VPWSDDVKLRSYLVDVPEETQVVVGQGLFSPLNIEELFRLIAIAAPSSTFAVAMVEGSSGVVRHSANDERLRALATSHAMAIGAGHFFIVLVEGAFPTQLLPALKQIPSVVGNFVAPGNPVKVVLADVGDGMAVLGVSDGQRATAIAGEGDVSKRRQFLRGIGYLEPES